MDAYVNLNVGVCVLKWFEKQTEKGELKKLQIPCPTVLKLYNTHMGGVDKVDQLVSTRVWDRKSPTKLYLRLHFNYFKQALVNAKITNEQKIAPISSAKDFRMALVKGMVGNCTSRN
ncbi:unnamed protein product [Lepeophtheirus salmonis]|uniref:(salmon louse) hypothetical protein n=1 Tax=Lepeophtheirus salmonis TaxID=72036 RepID=A0A7R8H2S9_LEPSM|nr:unnamed protein product [Lepeophtheirus salmonis]CAF2833630.1 unnamed protein product [Lepeophtheirus salmonis]